MPVPFEARTRTKYVPAPTPVAANNVAVLPVLRFARLARPDDEPASRTYPVGAHPPLGAVQVSVSVEPATFAVKPDGAPGRDRHEVVPPATVTTTSFDDGLRPALFFARTRTKYVPLGTSFAVSAGPILPVSKFARSASPAADPASTTYDEGGSPPVGGVHPSVTVCADAAPCKLSGAVGATDAAPAGRN